MRPDGSIAGDTDRYAHLVLRNGGDWSHYLRRGIAATMVSMKIRRRALALIAGVSSAAAIGVVALTAAPQAQAVAGGHGAVTPKSWSVEILRSGRPWCSGSLVSQYWILTAGHCLKGVPVSQLTVRVGSIHAGHGVLRAVRRTAVNPHFRGNKHDVGLINLYTPTGKTPIRLSDNVYIGQHVTGYGYGSMTNGRPSPVLKYARNKVSYLDGVQFGTVLERSSDGSTAPGDSGGPWVNAAGQQVGVINSAAGCIRSGGIGSITLSASGQRPTNTCGRKPTVSAFAARIAPNHGWIHRTVAGG